MLLSSDPSPSVKPILVVFPTPSHLLLTFGIYVGVVVVAVLLGMWVRQPARDGFEDEDNEQTPMPGDGSDPEKTVDLSPHRKVLARSTGTVCAPGYRHEAAHDKTVSMDLRALR
ncbi:hypothetical protein QQG74_09970 [Micromonospora sp. FIMYZ51]|uniref:hypothetical protein n=1 Tax=Micromonospora sp. FIMYZ51 TaxID=3051832 RepID=UPI00311F4820